MNNSYFDYNLPIDKLINNKFKLSYKYNKYDIIKLFLFIRKIWNYEPHLLIIISQIHNYNYSNIIDFYKVDIRKPIRMNDCCYYDYEFQNKKQKYIINIGNTDETEDESEQEDDNEFQLSICSCVNCDLYGYYLLKPYRINKITLLKLINKK